MDQNIPLSTREIDRIIGMAWEDRTPFEAIEHQFGLKEADVIRLMRRQLTEKNWKKWRARVQGRKTKHRALSRSGTSRFRSKAQRHISQNRISGKK